MTERLNWTEFNPLGVPSGSAVKNPPVMLELQEAAGLSPGFGKSSGEGHSNPIQYSCLENPMDRGVWRATVHWVAKSRIGLKWLSTQACTVYPLYSGWGELSFVNSGSQSFKKKVGFVFKDRRQAWLLGRPGPSLRSPAPLTLLHVWEPGGYQLLRTLAYILNSRLFVMPTTCLCARSSHWELVSL